MIIFPPVYDENKIKHSYKWMWHPEIDTILVSYGQNMHSIAYNLFKRQNKNIPDFYDWIRFIHLKPADFKEKGNKSVLCVRSYIYNISNDQITSMVKMLGIESKIIFDIDNEKLQNLTGYFLAKY